jgi:hypothetical protein
MARCVPNVETRKLLRARRTAARRLSTLSIVVALLCSIRVGAENCPSDPLLAEQVRQLTAEQHWSEIVSLLAPMSVCSADLDFYYGTALARLGRWQEAESAFEAGSHLAPNDSRFPMELAGVAFKQKLYPQAARRLRRALRLAPDDSYGNEFLGTVYFLEGNLEAALRYWNRVGKPQSVELRVDPVPRVDPALLDRAFAFSPASTLQLSDFRTTNERIRGLGIFPRYQFDLRAREDDTFDVVFRNQERDGFGRNKWEGLFLFLRGLPFLTVTPEFYNLRHQAINFVSLVRWDAQKRRVFAQLSSPFEGNAKYRYTWVADLRSENWDITNSVGAPVLASLNLRREALGFNLLSFTSGRWRWSVGAELSHRDFRNVVSGAVLTQELLAKGYQLKQFAQVETKLWQVPERRFTLFAGASSQAARLWSQKGEISEKLQGSLGWHLFPQARGDDYEMQQQIHVGKTFGTVPFDELFMLGLERDNDLWMRGHIGTHNGRKGSAPLGRSYFLSNWEADKNVYGNGLLTVKLGPFLDTGQITDPAPELGSRKWLWDTGAQLKLNAFGTGVVFSYGKDLRSGSNVYYLMMLR